MRTYTGLQRDKDAVTVALELNKLYPDDPEILTTRAASTEITPFSR